MQTITCRIITRYCQNNIRKQILPRNNFRFYGNYEKYARHHYRKQSTGVLIIGAVLGASYFLSKFIHYFAFVIKKINKAGQCMEVLYLM